MLRKKASGPLVLKREMREFASQLDAQERALSAKVTGQEALQHETSTLESELERLRQLQQTSEKEAVSLDHELRRASDLAPVPEEVIRLYDPNPPEDRDGLVFKPPAEAVPASGM